MQENLPNVIVDKFVACINSDVIIPSKPMTPTLKDILLLDPSQVASYIAKTNEQSDLLKEYASNFDFNGLSSSKEPHILSALR